MSISPYCLRENFSYLIRGRRKDAQRDHIIWGRRADTVTNSQLPVRARSVVRYVVMSDHEYIDGQSALEGQSIYWQGDLIIYGNWSSVGLFVHETTHNMDWWIAGGGDHMYSGKLSTAHHLLICREHADTFAETREWEAIFDNDTCVADWYSKAGK